MTDHSKEIANLYALLSAELNPGEARKVEQRIRRLEAEDKAPAAEPATPATSTMTDKTFTRAQVYAFALWLARQAEDQEATARELHDKRKLQDAHRHYGEAKAFQSAAQHLRDLANGAFIEGISNQSYGADLPRLTAQGAVIHERNTEEGAVRWATALYGDNTSKVIAFTEGWRYANDPRFQNPQDGTSPIGRAQVEAQRVFPGWGNRELSHAFLQGWRFAQDPRKGA